MRTSNKYGKCSKLGRHDSLRFAYNDGIVFAMTPRHGVCNNHMTNSEAKERIGNEE